MYEFGIETPVGFLIVRGEDRVHSIAFADEAPLVEAPAEEQPIEDQLRRYFEGTRITFDVPLDAGGTEFQRAVWREVAKIPFGETRSYLEIAEALGDRNLTRAVGAANGANPLAIVVPCHRVVGSDGSLTGYAGGLERKRWLLDHESGQRRLF